MPTLLQVDSSPMGDFSISRYLTKEFVQRWKSANPEGKVVVRDLTTTAIPAIHGAWIMANHTPEESRSQEQKEILALSDALTREVLEADEYVIGIPMHNWGPATTFKLWADQLVRFGLTLIATPSGPKGVLDQKRATFIVAAGGVYSPGSASASNNYIEPWLRTLFGYLGVKKMQFVLADGAAEVRYGRIDRAAFLAPHVEAVDALFAENYLYTGNR